MASKKLTLFDVTSLVVGAIVGADIYIAASFGSGLLGPASLLAWIVAAIFAIIIALTFGKCTEVVKKVGGPYAYARQAFGHFPGFMAGWSLWLAEVTALSVFPLAFVTYFSFFMPVNFVLKIVVIFLFIMFLFISNYFGIKKAARTNDALTVLKLAPLFLLIVVGLLWVYSKPQAALDNLTPFAPFGFSGFGLAVVLIFWAYTGFEHATVISPEIKNSRKVLPKAIIYGMLIVTIFYLLTNLVIVSADDYTQLAQQQTPLTHVAAILMGTIGAAIMALGAMISVSGSNESGLIGSVRLAYAMAADGYFPRRMADLHNKYSTPHVSLAVHCVIMFVMAAFLPVTALIAFVVFNLAFAYMIVALSAMKLRKDNTTKILGIASVLICLYLISQNTIISIISGIVLLLFGWPVYKFFAPKAEIREAKAWLLKRENRIKHIIERQNLFLARAVRHVAKHLQEREEFYRKEKMKGEAHAK